MTRPFVYINNRRTRWDWPRRYLAGFVVLDDIICIYIKILLILKEDIMVEEIK